MKGLFFEFAKAICFTVVVVIAGGYSFTAYAIPPTGTRTVYSDFTLNIVDSTGGEVEGAILITLTDIAAGNQFTYHITRENYAYGVSIYDTIYANTTYTVHWGYTSPSFNFTIIDALTNEPIERFPATASGVILNLVIRSTNENSFSDDYPVGYSAAGSDVGVAVVVTAIDDIYMEAAVLWETLLYELERAYNDDARVLDFRRPSNPVSEILDRGSLENFLLVTNGTEDEWNALSDKERFLLSSTYLLPQSRLLTDPNRFNMSSITAFRQMVASYVGRLRPFHDASNAFSDVLYWQFNYIHRAGAAYNFFTGMNYIEYTRMVWGVAADPVDLTSSDDSTFYDELMETFLEMVESGVISSSHPSA